MALIARRVENTAMIQGSSSLPEIEGTAVGLQSLAGLDRAARQMLEPPGHLHLLYGDSGVFTAGLAIASATRRPLAVIDAATKFNSYTLARIAALLGIPPKLLLRRTQVTRSFTAFQTEAAITLKLPRFLAATSCRMVVILGLLHTYYDEQVKPHECRQSLERIVRALRADARANVQILIADVEVSGAPPGKESLFSFLRESTDIVMRLDHAAAGYQLSMERRVLPWDATTTRSRLSSTGTEKHGANSAGP